MALFSFHIPQFINDILNKLFDLLPAPIKNIVSKVVEGVTEVTTLFERIDNLIESVKSEITAWKNFRINPKFKSRVVNIPKAYDRTKEFLESFPATWASFQDLIKQFKEKLDIQNPVAEAEEAAAGVEETGAASILDRFPKLVKGLEKLAGVVTLVVDSIVTISNALDDVQAIVDEVTSVREEIEDLETLFLSQSNARRSVRLEDGGTVKFRVGNLHD